MRPTRRGRTIRHQRNDAGRGCPPQGHERLDLAIQPLFIFGNFRRRQIQPSKARPLEATIIYDLVGTVLIFALVPAPCVDLAPLHAKTRAGQRDN